MCGKQATDTSLHPTPSMFVRPLLNEITEVRKDFTLITHNHWSITVVHRKCEFHDRWLRHWIVFSRKKQHKLHI